MLMLRIFKTYWLLLFFLLIQIIPLRAAEDSIHDTKVFTFDINEMIAPPAWHSTRQALNQAQQEKADIVLIHMNTYGGLLDAADSIRTKILDFPLPVYVFIDKNAASAGALISLACDSIYMAPGANIGAATVVDQQGKPMPEKYQSYMRSLMRSTAEAKGRNPDIAQAMVDPRIRVPGVSDSGQVLSMTPSEAIKNGICEAEVNNIKEIMSHAGIKNYTIIPFQLSATDSIIRFLIHPWVSGLLIMIIIGGIYFEFHTPGIGFPLAAAVTAAVLYFAPLYIQGLANHWEILLFVLGLVLLALEIFVIPGFGVSGILGILFVVTGLSLAMTRSMGPGLFDYNLSALVKAFSIVIIAMFLALSSSIYLTSKLFGSNRFSYLGLERVHKKSEGYTSASKEYQKMIGQEGICLTKLRPAGKVKINDDVYDAVAIHNFIDKDEPVEVVDYRQSQLVVKRKT